MAVLCPPSRVEMRTDDDDEYQRSADLVGIAAVGLIAFMIFVALLMLFNNTG